VEDGGAPAEVLALMLAPASAEVAPLSEETRCWYFETANTEPLAIQRWASTMTDGVDRITVYFTDRAALPAGTESRSKCGPLVGGASDPAVWIYDAQQASSELALPKLEGGGAQLAMAVSARQAGFVQVQYRNPSLQVMRPAIRVSAYAVPAGTSVVKTATYSTYNSQIDIPPGAVEHAQAQTCPVPADRMFWLVTTRANQRVTRSQIWDGPADTGAMRYDNTGWIVRDSRLAAPAAFTSGGLTYRCQWSNPTARSIIDDEEVCMAAGYFFPATGPVVCHDGGLVRQ
jgi:hypothetical protein